MNVASPLISLITAASLSACAPAGVLPHQSVQVTLRDSDLSTTQSSLRIDDLPAAEYCYALHIVDETADGAPELRTPGVWSDRNCDSSPNSLGRFIWLGNGRSAQKIDLPISQGKKIRFDIIGIKTADAGARLGPTADCNYDISLPNADQGLDQARMRLAHRTDNAVLDETTAKRFDIRLIASKRNFEVQLGSTQAVLDYAPTFTNGGETDFGYYGRACQAAPTNFCDFGMRRQSESATGKLFARSTLLNNQLSPEHDGSTDQKRLEICSPQQFVNLQTLVGQTAWQSIKYISIEDDLDFENHRIKPLANTASSSGFFRANLIGNNKTIKNLYVSNQTNDPVGIISYAVGYAGAFMRDLHLENVGVINNSGTISSVGSLVGHIVDYEISNVTLKNDAKHYIYSVGTNCGGLFGQATFNALSGEKTWSDIYVNTLVSASSALGGVVGQFTVFANPNAYKFHFNRLGFNGGAIGGGVMVGGIIGSLTDTILELSSSFSIGQLAGYNDMGFLVGMANNGSKIVLGETYSSGNILQRNGQQKIGGAFGEISELNLTANSAVDVAVPDDSTGAYSHGYVAGLVATPYANGFEMYYSGSHILAHHSDAPAEWLLLLPTAVQTNGTQTNQQTQTGQAAGQAQQQAEQLAFQIALGNGFLSHLSSSAWTNPNGILTPSWLSSVTGMTSLIPSNLMPVDPATVPDFTNAASLSAAGIGSLLSP